MGEMGTADGDVMDVVAGIVWQGQRFLAARRPQGKPMAGWWEFPGGKVEAGESPAAALVRELAEELGIGVRACTFWQEVEHFYAERQVRVRLHFFHVTEFDGTPRPNEGQELRWLEPDMAQQMDFLPADKALLPLIERPADLA